MTLKILKIISISFLLIILNSCIVIRESSFNQDRYLGKKIENPVGIYSNKSQKNSFLPIMDFYPHGNVRGVITKLMLVEFKNHPEYYMIELQEVTDGDSIGMEALIYGHNNELIDIYYTNHLVLNIKGYESLLNKVTIQKTDFEANLALSSNGLSASLSLKDKNGKAIELEIKENKKVKPAKGILAPIGNVSKNPDKFSFIFLKGIIFIKQKGTEFSLKIDGKDFAMAKIPLLFDYEKVYNAKYSFDNVMIDWNSNIDGVINVKKIDNNQIIVPHETWNYCIKRNNDFIEIDSITTTVNNKKFVLHFSPPIPDLACLKDETLLEGKFAVQIDNITAIVGGNYKVKTENNTVLFDMQFEKGWQPMPGKLWLKDYKWTLALKQNDGKYNIQTSNTIVD
ncbi:MAG: hypothetical protein Q7V19_02195, partial [Bacteroidales bacterium]|nr:hypothetical protein [Bacteroidales bacterium]